jgi:hypothetical protein
MNGNQRDRNPLLLLTVLTALSILLMITFFALGYGLPLLGRVFVTGFVGGLLLSVVSHTQHDSFKIMSRL